MILYISYGGSNSYANSFSLWCNDQLLILSEAKADALIHYNSMNNANTLYFLEQGLHDAHENSNNTYANALTSRAIKRGINIFHKIEPLIEHQSNEQVSLIHFLFEYYQFISNVAYQIDIPYFIPASTAFFPFRNYKKISRKIIEFSKGMVEMTLFQLADRTYQSGQFIIAPLGNPKLFLNSLQLTTAYYAKDLGQSIYATKNACKINKLKKLSAKLKAYNSPSNNSHHKRPPSYINDFYAVNQSYHKAYSIIYEDCQFPLNRHSHGHHLHVSIH